MKWSVEWPRPKTLSQRMHYAATCSRDLELPEDVPVYVDDTATDAFNEAFKAWPTCYYLVDRDGRLVYILECPEREASYDINEMFDFVYQYYKDLVEERGVAKDQKPAAA